MSHFEQKRDKAAELKAERERVAYLERELQLRLRQRSNALSRVMPYQDKVKALEKERDAARGEVERLRKALKRIVENKDNYNEFWMQKIAREALGVGE